MSASLHDSDTTALPPPEIPGRFRHAFTASTGRRLSLRVLAPREWYVRGERHRRDAPAVVDAEKGREWWIFGQRHCEGGPAIERLDGTRAWWLKGRDHRTDGPAVILVGDTRE